MIKYTIMITSILFLTACGGGGSSSSTNNGSTITMIPEQVYTVYPGDKLIKNTPDTLVKITHTDGHTESLIELVAGDATIIKK
jgi:hypothetical protein